MRAEVSSRLHYFNPPLLLKWRLFRIAQERQASVMATLISLDYFPKAHANCRRRRNMITDTNNIDSLVANYVVPFVNRSGNRALTLRCRDALLRSESCWGNKSKRQWGIAFRWRECTDEACALFASNNFREPGPRLAGVTDRESTRNKLKTKGDRMRKTTGVLSLVSIAMLLGAWGCSTLHKSDLATLQGTWQGREIGGKTEGVCYFVVSGNNAEFRGADTNEWIKGTFSLREDTNPRQFVCLTTACSYPPHIGKTVYAIYRIEGGTVKLTGNEPGNPDVPSGFDASGARQFEFRKQ
jgi:uncharacterized protein (TIGR03067 family)